MFTLTPEQVATMEITDLESTQERVYWNGDGEHPQVYGTIGLELITQHPWTERVFLRRLLGVTPD